MPSATITSIASANRLTTLRAMVLSLMFATGGAMSQAQAAEAVGQRWYQIEMTVFTHETSNLELELWSPERLSLGFPERMRTLRPVSDVLQLDDWSVLLENLPEPEATPVVGPHPYAPAAAGEGFSIPDLQRDPFWQLPSADHDFINTNRALTQSSQHRILFHAAWRQPMTRLNAATPVAVVGGRAFNDRHELEGSLRLYFNNSEDRIVLEPNLWLSSFGSTRGGATSEWQLPPLPEILQTAVAETADTTTAARNAQERYAPTRIIQVNQSREARSNEFHYIDHPAIGVFIQLTPYEVPPPPEPPAPQPGASNAAPPLELQ